MDWRIARGGLEAKAGTGVREGLLGPARLLPGVVRSTIPTDMSAILDFYKGSGGNSGGWRLHEILEWSDDELEEVHDFIQWLFPLPEHSQANPYAPLLDPATIQAFHNDEKLKRELRNALDRMLLFYGFVRHQDSIFEGEQFRVRAANWLTPGNHNHLRLTRMIRSLRILGLEAEAQALWKALQAVYQSDEGTNSISQRTYNFWTRAATEAPRLPRGKEPPAKDAE